jgi:hypothetical protein
MLLTGALCAVQSNKEFTVFVKWLPALAVLGVLYAYPAHAAEPLEDASEALENLDDLVKSVDSVGHSFGRIVQPRQYGFRWNGGEIRRVCQGTLVLRMIAATMTAMTINTLPDLARS